MSADYAPLTYWVREREALRLRKEAGEPFPWTVDPILMTYRFCCVRREDDRVTVWIRREIRERFADNRNLWLMLCIARQVNWPEALRTLISAGDLPWPVGPSFDPAIMRDVLEGMAKLGKKVFTGAYIVPASSKKGETKAKAVADRIGALWRDRARFDALFSAERRRLSQVHERLMRYDGFGPFLAYQSVVDMRFTRLLDEAEDRTTWAAAGPGTIRGLNRVHGRPVDRALSQGQALSEMREIFRRVPEESGVPMDFSDVPNILCETDKYLRVKNGEGKPRALYVKGRGS